MGYHSHVHALGCGIGERMKKRYAAVVALTMPATMYFEGLELKAYFDKFGNVPTLCYGETEGVKMGDTATKPECDERLAIKLGYLSYRVDMLVEPEMPTAVHAAAVDLVYNVGEGSFKRSTMLKKLNAGDFKGACNELTKWVYAGGIKLKGLVKRREHWRKQCLAGL